ncbi:hypothetical protein TPA0909_58110 [Streptomyces albus]|nr:hypothetical protein TPA0909_00430 [Streptomyces albus]GHJ24197.1 hypothetical protein TPA0909_58110 [Streptomyces albus]
MKRAKERAQPRARRISEQRFATAGPGAGASGSVRARAKSRQHGGRWPPPATQLDPLSAAVETLLRKVASAGTSLIRAQLHGQIPRGADLAEAQPADGC